MTQQGYIANDPRIRLSEFWYKAVDGQVPSIRILDKFGKVDATSTLKPICFSGVYQMPTAPVSLELVSTDVNDTAAGTGAREITILGCGANFGLLTQVVATNGLTAVAIPIDMIRVYRAFVSGSGVYADHQTTFSHVGDIIIREAGVGPEWARIDASDIPVGTTQIGFFTVEAGVTAFIESILHNVTANQNADIYLFFRLEANNITPPTRAFIQDHGFGGFVGQFEVSGQRLPIGPFPGPADIGFFAKVQTSAEVDISFKITIFDNLT